MASKELIPGPQDPRNFETTHWKVIVAAGGGSREALTTLCRTYWRPVYTFFRRTRGAEEALDLTQGFFARLLETGSVAAADETRGRFRNWLLKAASNYRANDQDRARAQKRGGGIANLSIDAASAEEGYRSGPREEDTPERSYEQRWALTLLARVLHRLGDEYDKRGQTPLFEHLKHCLIGDNERRYKEIAEELEIKEGNFRHHVFDCKSRYRELLEEEVAQTVSTDEDIEEELRFLREVLRWR
jgi:RNA polymerase sigma factor (sigma-70 family)